MLQETWCFKQQCGQWGDFVSVQQFLSLLCGLFLLLQGKGLD
jgi:hypothetical protein